MSMWLQPCGCVTEDGNVEIVLCPLHDASHEMEAERATSEEYPLLTALLHEIYDPEIARQQEADRLFTLPDMRWWLA